MGDTKEGFCSHDVSSCNHCHPDRILVFDRVLRLGSITLALHDASDIVLETAKLFKYAGADIGASVCFGLFAISWVLRLIIFPFWIIRASSSDVIEVLPLSETHAFYMYYILNTLLLMLLVFHIYWWILIFRMIKKQLQNKGKVGEDIRSDSEDDDDYIEKTHKKYRSGVKYDCFRL